MSNWYTQPLMDTAMRSIYGDLQALLLRRLWSNLQGSEQAAASRKSTGRVGTQSLEPSAFDGLIEAAAARHQVDADLVKAVIKAESNFNPDAVSHAGAKGLMQLMDGTADYLGVEDSFDAAQNIEGGVTYLAEQLRRFKGDTRLALAAYNAGPGTVQRYGDVPPIAETQTYVKRVLGFYSSGTEQRRFDYSV